MIDPGSTIKVVCFKLAGDWDFSRRDELQAMLRPAESLDEVLLDFSGVTFIDASVLGSLLRLHRCMIEHSRLGAIRIIAASRHIARIFEICELQELFGLRSPTIETVAGNRRTNLPMIRGSVFTTA
jgi:anti-anti-sigma factor